MELGHRISFVFMSLLMRGFWNENRSGEESENLFYRNCCNSKEIIYKTVKLRVNGNRIPASETNTRFYMGTLYSPKQLTISNQNAYICVLCTKSIVWSKYITNKVASDCKCSFVHKPYLHLFVFCLSCLCLLYCSAWFKLNTTIGLHTL